MNLQRRFLAPALLGALAASAAGQGVGTDICEVDLKDFTLTEASSYGDFTGRTVLIEFFSYT